MWNGIAVLIAAYDTHRGGRKHLLYRTCRTAADAFPTSIICVVDNGSVGQDAELAEQIATSVHGVAYRNVPPENGGNRSPGRSANARLRVLQFLADAGVPLPSAVVLSDDDAWWLPGAEDRLTTVWRGVLETTAVAGSESRLALLSGYLEPLWHWNEPRSTLTIQDRETGRRERVLVRDSAPAVAWSFLLDEPAKGPGAWFRRWLAGGPPPFQESERYDYDACTRLASEGLLVGQMDLAEHTGWGVSGWGNNAIDSALPLDRELWDMKVR